MCKSVPQMEAARTRTRISLGPNAGTLTDSMSMPAAGRSLRSACIVVEGIGIWRREEFTAGKPILAHGADARKLHSARAPLFRYNLPGFEPPPSGRHPFPRGFVAVPFRAASFPLAICQGE